MSLDSMLIVAERINSHTLNAICLPHDNATGLKSQPSQNVYNKQRKKYKNLPEPDTLLSN